MAFSPSGRSYSKFDFPEPASALFRNPMAKRRFKGGLRLAVAKHCVPGAMMLLAAQSPVWGASSQDIRGTVRDPSGAVVAKAPLGSCFVLSATVSRPLPKGLTAFFQGENLTNEVYNIAKTPTPNIGQPILVRGGLRWHSRR